MRGHVLPAAPRLVWRLVVPEGEQDGGPQHGQLHGDKQSEPDPAPGAELGHEAVPRELVIVVGPHEERVGAGKALVEAC